jgi:hypothetical protein
MKLWLQNLPARVFDEINNKLKHARCCERLQRQQAFARLGCKGALITDCCIFLEDTAVAQAPGGWESGTFNHKCASLAMQRCVGRWP